MRLRTLKASIVLLAGFTLIAMSTRSVAPMAAPPLPNPVLIFMGQEQYSTGGTDFTRYTYSVFNRSDYPNKLFTAAPKLPPCGKNTKSSRTWVDLFDQNGKRLNEFCALSNIKDLSKIWFELERDVIPPSYIYIEMNDRKTDTRYKSNLADTTM